MIKADRKVFWLSESSLVRFFEFCKLKSHCPYLCAYKFIQFQAYFICQSLVKPFRVRLLVPWHLVCYHRKLLFPMIHTLDLGR